MRPTKPEEVKDLQENAIGSSLRDVIEQEPQLLNTKTITLSNAGLEYLGHLPEPAKTIENLILKKNYLSDLDGIDRFPQLVYLDLSNNQIEGIENVHYLRRLKQLSELNLSNNPVTKLSNYRDIVLCLLPTLTNLDEIEISQSERDQIDPRLQNQLNLLDIAMYNYQDIIKYQSILNKTKLHIELAQRGLDRNSNVAGLEMEKFDAMFAYPDLIDERIRNTFRNELHKDIMIIEQTLLKKRDLKAAAEVLVKRQKEIIQRFEEVIEKRSAELRALREQGLRKVNRQTTLEDSKSFSTQAGTSIKQRKDASFSTAGGGSGMLQGRRTTTGNLNEIGNTIDASFGAVQDPSFVGQRTSTVRVHKSELGYYIKEHTRKVIRTSAKKSTRTPDRKKKQESKVGSPDSILGTSTNPFATSGARLPDTSYSRDMRSTYAGYQWSPKKEDRTLVIERDRTIDNLALNLKQKMGDLLKLEEDNKGLKDKLRVLEATAKQSELLANKEYKNILAELEKTSEGKEKLEADVRKLQEFLEEIKGKTLELEVQNKELLQEAFKAKIFAHELAVIQTIEGKYGIAEKYRDHNLQAWCFKLLYLAAQRSKAEQLIYSGFELRRNRWILDSSFRHLQRATILRKIAKMKDFRRGKILTSSVFYSWLYQLKCEKKLRAHQVEKTVKLAFQTFQFWKVYVAISQNKRHVTQKAEGYYIKKLLFNGIVAFKLNYEIYRLPEEEEEQTLAECDLFYQKRMLNVFWARWKYCHNEVLVPRRMKEIAASNFRAVNLARVGFELLLNNILFYRSAESRAAELAKRVQLFTMRGYFQVWKEDYHDYHQYLQQLKAVKDQYIINRRWKIWRSAYLISSILKRLTVRAIQHREEVLKLNSFRLIMKNWVSAKLLKEKQEYIRGKSSYNRLVHHYGKWRSEFAKVNGEKRIIHLRYQRTYREVFEEWISYTVKKKEKKQRELRLRRHLDSKNRKLTKNSFQSWVLLRQYSRHLKKVAAKVGAKQRVFKFKKFWAALKEEQIYALKLKNDLLLKEKNSTYELIKEQNDHAERLKKEIDEIDAEKRSYERKAENQENDLKHKENRIDNLQKRIIEVQRSEQALSGELKNRDETIHSLERRLVTAEDALEQREKQIDGLVEEHAAARRDYQNRNGQLQQEIRESKEQFIRSEQNLAQASQEFKNYETRAERKAQGLENEVLSLKAIIDEKDIELLKALKQLEELVIQNEKLQQRVKSTESEADRASKDFKRNYDSLYEKNQEQENQISRLRKKSRDFAEQLQDQKGKVMKYEVQVERMTQRQHIERGAFMKQMKEKSPSRSPSKYSKPQQRVETKHTEKSFSPRRSPSRTFRRSPLRTIRDTTVVTNENAQDDQFIKDLERTRQSIQREVERKRKKALENK